MHTRTTYRLWPAAICVAVVLLLAATVSAVTVKLRSGKQVIGSVVAKDDTNIVLRTTVKQGTGTNGTTATKNVTIAWRDVTTATLKALHPDLHARLKAKADERAALKAEQAKKIEDQMLAEGKVLDNGKWITQAEAQMARLRRIDLKVNTRETTKVVDRSSNRVSSYSRIKDTTMQCWGEVEVKLAGLDAKDTHSLKVNVTHYRRGSAVYYASNGSTSSGRTDKIDQEETVTGATENKLIFKTSEYERTKSSYSSSYYGSSKDEYGLKSDGFDISISIDGTLVYEQKKGEAAKYYHVGNR